MTLSISRHDLECMRNGAILMGLCSGVSNLLEHPITGIGMTHSIAFGATAGSVGVLAADKFNGAFGYQPAKNLRAGLIIGPLAAYILSQCIEKAGIDSSITLYGAFVLTASSVALTALCFFITIESRRSL